ncbi:MAG TPA: hypothetical protein IAC53_08070 [Candidatus Fimenecus excrementigallinarum]|uniref:Uncharacterized protein n=1 Tax=Candidatus Fimenecus excrementigallinarum TaxID=2840816 RepID=A0A9D1IIC0_9FIRM|nr:hypothetical protein [Candidatus Fimenecus excrementigallinarum]
MLLSLCLGIIALGASAALLIARRLKRSPAAGLACEVLEGVQAFGYVLIALGSVAFYGLASGQIRL